MASDEYSVVHLVRHGEVHNPRGVLYARLPGYGLSRTGRLMAERAGQALAGRPVRVLRSSPLQRALDTTWSSGLVGPGLPVQIDERLIEADSRLQGQVFGRYNKALADPRNWWLFRNPLRPSWGEPYVQIVARVMQAVWDAAEDAGPGGEAVLISHQSPIWTTRCSIEGRSLAHLPTSRECGLASITSLVIDRGHIIDIDYQEPAADLYREKGSRAFSQGSD